MKKPAMKLTLNDLADIVAACEEKGVMFQVIVAALPKRKECKAAAAGEEADS